LIVELDLSWRLGPELAKPVPPILFALLRAVEREGSLSAAAKQCRISYRSAWNQINNWENNLGSPLIHSTRGQGATLSLLGAGIIWGFDFAKDQLRDASDTTANHIQSELNHVLQKPSAQLLSIQASHCLSHDLLRKLFHSQTGSVLELKHCGSGRSLEHLRAGDCDAAGFHLVDGQLRRSFCDKYMQLIDVDKTRLVHSLKRRQGLIVKRGNPMGLRDVTDLAGGGMRLVNRQPSSGTRLLFDQLLINQGINPDEINGYDNEEFTHSAVAALVAGGSADVGVGIEAAALKFNLGFIPLATETYYYAIPKNKWENEGVQALLGLLAGASWNQGIKKIEGYDASRAGTVQDAAQVLN
jgi:molybdate transport repressor ModE-like protein